MRCLQASSMVPRTASTFDVLHDPAFEAREGLVEGRQSTGIGGHLLDPSLGTAAGGRSRGAGR